MSQILTNVLPLEYTISEGSGKLKIQGIFQKAETKNENGRVYPRTILEREINRIQPILKERKMLGELGHPASAEINLDRVSILVTEAKMEGNDVLGKAEIMTGTPYGAILESLIKHNVTLGISSRGKGSTVYRNGVDEVDESYSLLTWDTVSRPSTPGAYPTALVESSELKKEGLIGMGSLIEKVMDGGLTDKEMIDILKWSNDSKKIFY